MTIQMIRAVDCMLSARNVRRTPVDLALANQFKADIASRGVLQNLIGFAIPRKRGKFEITAGGRRLAAVHALIAEAVFPTDYAIPVFVLNDTATASETSLAENFQRQAMNPADECTAFRHFIEVDGATPDDIARRFGLTVRFVEGRVRLGNLAEPVFEALRSGEISLEIAQAFATTSDTARQASVFAQLKDGYYGLDARTVRRMMTDETITGEHRLAKLVGRDAYVEAGGRIERDLFAEAADELWLNTDLVESLAQTRMSQAAASITGFAKVVPTLDHRPDWQLTQMLRAVRGERIAPSEADQTRLAAIDEQLEAIEANAEDPDGDAYSDAEAEQVEALQAEAEALRNRVAPVDDATRAAATAFMVIDADGQPKLYETVYVDPRPATSEESSEGEAPLVVPDDDIPLAPALGKPLRDELAVQRTQLLALHVASDSHIAIDLAIFLLADAQASQGRGFDHGSTLRAPRPTRAPFGYKPEGAADEQLRLIEDSLDYDWAKSRDTGERFDAFRALDADKRGAWAGWTVAKTLEAMLGDEPNARFHNHLGRSLGIDAAAWWRPTAANFFNRVRKSVVLDTLDAIGGSDLRNRYAAAKKGDLANAAEKLCAGASIVEAEVRAAALAWVPDVMQFARAADVSTAGDDSVAPEPDTGDATRAATDDPDAKDEPGADDDEVEQAA